MFLSDEGPTLETLDFTIRIGITPTFFTHGYCLAAFVSLCDQQGFFARCVKTGKHVIKRTSQTRCSASWDRHRSSSAQNRYSTRSPTSPFFCPTFFTAAILLASGFGFTSFCLCRFELSQSILIHRPRSKVNNELFFFVKTT